MKNELPQWADIYANCVDIANGTALKLHSFTPIVAHGTCCVSNEARSERYFQIFWILQVLILWFLPLVLASVSRNTSSVLTSLVTLALSVCTGYQLEYMVVWTVCPIS